MGCLLSFSRYVSVADDKELDNQHPIDSADHLLYFVPRNQLELLGSHERFFRYHHNILRNFVQGKCKGRNRFRQLIFGKLHPEWNRPTLLVLFYRYITYYYPSIIVLYRDFSIYPPCRILDILEERRPNIFTTPIDRKEPLCRQIEAIDTILEKHNLKLIVLFDQFEHIYRQASDIGCPIINEVAIWVGSDRGTMHMIISGDEEILPILAFGKPNDISRDEYPSFCGQDLNNTKLWPRMVGVLCP
jgi:hypothetical protein